jgi:hypothetical protein
MSMIQLDNGEVIDMPGHYDEGTPRSFAIYPGGNIERSEE